MSVTYEQTYDQIGTSYNAYRACDSRITQTLIRSINCQPGSTIAEIGAGTCNYSLALAKEGYLVKAIEPSIIMRNQAQSHQNLQIINGSAERIPLNNNAVDGVLCMLSYHHFVNKEQAVQEMLRICRNGRIVLFTFDPYVVTNSWFSDYFPSVWQMTFNYFQSIDSIIELFKVAQNNKNIKITIESFALPRNLQDLFAGAGWYNPEIYLNEFVRAGISSFALADQNILSIELARLARDLKNGVWDRKYGYLRKLESFDAGYKIILIENDLC